MTISQWIQLIGFMGVVSPLMCVMFLWWKYRYLIRDEEARIKIMLNRDRRRYDEQA